MLYKKLFLLHFYCFTWEEKKIKKIGFFQKIANFGINLYHFLTLTMKFKFLNTNNKLNFYTIEDSSLGDVPLYGDGVPAGFPSPADDYLDMDLNLHDYLVQHPAATFCVKAIGDSMIDAGIQSSDVMVVDRALTPKNNDIVLAVVNGEFTVKRIKKNDDELYLMPANDNYRPMKITEDMDFQVWGVVTFIIHKANASTGRL